MNDYYLSFEDEAQANAVLYTEVPVEFDEEGNAAKFDTRRNFANIDTIGVIQKPTGETIEQDGMAVPVVAPIPGWHVNVRLADEEDGASLLPFAVNPATPMRVWG